MVALNISGGEQFGIVAETTRAASAFADQVRHPVGTPSNDISITSAYEVPPGKAAEKKHYIGTPGNPNQNQASGRKKPQAANRVRYCSVAK